MSDFERFYAATRLGFVRSLTPTEGETEEMREAREAFTRAAARVDEVRYHAGLRDEFDFDANAFYERRAGQKEGAGDLIRDVSACLKCSEISHAEKLQVLALLVLAFAEGEEGLAEMWPT